MLNWNVKIRWDDGGICILITCKHVTVTAALQIVWYFNASNVIEDAYLFLSIVAYHFIE